MSTILLLSLREIIKFKKFPINEIRYYVSVRNLKKVSHVIFDLDGLLLDTESIFRKVILEIAKSHGKIYTPKIMSHVVSLPAMEGATVAVNEMQLPMSAKEFLEEYKNRAIKEFHLLELMPGAKKLVTHLYRTHVPMAVATTSTTDMVKLKISRYRTTFFSMFNHMIIGGSDPAVKFNKPNPDVFLLCASRFSNPPIPEHCLVLEDSGNGLAAALAAGMQCIVIPHPLVDQSNLKNATEILKSLEEVRPEKYGLPKIY